MQEFWQTCFSWPSRPCVLVPAHFYQNVGLFLILISFVFYVIWYVLIARTLFRLGRLEGEAIPQSQ